MISVTTKVEGLDVLEKQLRGLGLELGVKTLRSALMATAAPLRKEMKRLAPESPADLGPRFRRGKKGMVKILPGFLKHRIRARSAIRKVGKSSKYLSGNQIALVRVGAFTPYAGFVEYGTEKTRAQPFVRPAAHNKRVELDNRFREYLKKRIDKAIERTRKQP